MIGDRLAALRLQGRGVRQVERRGQDGFVLMATLVITLVFSITLVSILGYTMTASRASRGLGVVNDERRAADSAMERVVADIRADRSGNLGSGAPGGECASPEPNGRFPVDLEDGTGSVTHVEVECTVSQADPGDDERQVDLQATVGGKSIGAARVRIVDTSGVDDEDVAIPHPGYRVTVCDWHIGTLTGELAGCVTA